MKKLFLAIVLSGHFVSGICQDRVDSLWTAWSNHQDDSLRLEAISELTSFYRRTNPDSAYLLASKMIQLGEELESSYHVGKGLNIQASIDRSKGDYENAEVRYLKCLEIAKPLENRIPYAATLNNLAILYKLRGDLAKAIEMYTQSIQIRDEIGDLKGKSRTLHNIGIIYNDQGDTAKALVYYRESYQIKEELEDHYGTALTAASIGGIYSERDDYDMAEVYLQESLTIALEKGLRDFEPSARLNLGILHHKRGNYEQAKEQFELAREIAEETGDMLHTSGYQVAMAELHMQLDKHSLAIPLLEEALESRQAAGQVEGVRDAGQLLYKCYKKMGRSTDALRMHELYVLMRDSLNNETNQREILRQEYKYTYEKEALTDSLEFAKKEAIKDLEIQKQEVSISRQRIGLASAAFGLILIVALAFSIYRGKKRSDELLLNILPYETAQELKEKGSADAKLIDEVTVIFTDFKGFTALSEKLSPEELVEDLNECFSEFDRIMEKYGIEKIKTIGDAYMAAGGLPTPNSTHPVDCVKAALEMREFVEEGKKHKRQAGLPFFEIRIGVHTGPVVAGIVGIKKFQYDIWGDTVNTASRMESSGEIGKVNISEATYELLKDDAQFSFECRGKVAAKGKGEMEMYFVEQIT